MGKKSAAHQCWNFDDLLEKIWDCLRLVKLSTKTKDQLLGLNIPRVDAFLQGHGEHFCMKIYKNLSNNLNILIPSGWDLCET